MFSPNPHHFIEGADSFESGQSSTAEAFILGLKTFTVSLLLIKKPP